LTVEQNRYHLYAKECAKKIPNRRTLIVMENGALAARIKEIQQKNPSDTVE
jgi:hypothetical protein